MQSLSFQDVSGKFCSKFALEIKMPEKISEKYKWRKLIENNVKFQMTSKKDHK